MLAESVLSKHPDIAYLSEPTPIWKFGNAYKTHDILTVNNTNQESINHIIHAFNSFAISSGKKRLMEKHPSNCLRIPFIDHVFPDAKFVHLIRDGRDVALSAKVEWTGMPGDAIDRRDLRASPKLLRLVKTIRREIDKLKPRPRIYEIPAYISRLVDLVRRQIFGSDSVLWGPRIPGLKEIRSAYSLLETCAIQWEFCTRSAQSAGLMMPTDRFIEIRYEDLLQEPRLVVQKICEFLELNLNHELLEILVTDISRHAIVYKWWIEMDMDECNKLERLIGSTLKYLGYPLTSNDEQVNMIEAYHSLRNAS